MTAAMQASASRRFDHVDALRGFAIVLVVLGHALQGTLAAPDDNTLYRLIYSFHMPLFMFISGFVYSGAKRRIGDELRLKARTLLLPFLAWLPVTFIWMQQAPDPISLPTFLMQVLASPDAGGLWFLWVLLTINLLMLAGRLLLSSRPLVAASALWLLLNVAVLARPNSNVLGIKLLCWHFPFFVAGLLLRRHGVAALARPSVTLVCGVIFLLLFQGWSRVSDGGAAHALGAVHGVAGMLLLRAFNYATAFFAILALFSLFAQPTMAVPTKLFLGFGRISLEIYASHIYFISLAAAASAGLGWPDGVRVAAVFAIGLAGALLSNWAIKRWEPLARLMFGSQPQRAVHSPAN